MDGRKEGIGGQDLEAARGITFAVLVYLIWGAMPAYWRLLGHIVPATILAHRAIWSFACLGIILVLTRRTGSVRAAFRDRRKLGLLALASAALLVQWIAYMVAVDTRHLLDLSLGYYIFPLVAALLGRLVLGEAITRRQGIALALASIGVLAKIIEHRSVPVLALVLAVSFSLYGMVKRRIGIDPLGAVFLESLILLPLGLGYAAYAEVAGPGYLTVGDGRSTLLLIGGGILTALTLVLFAAGARRIPMLLLGLLQYISPTMVLVLGVVGYGEAVATVDWILFGLVWLAIVVSTLPSLAALRGRAGRAGQGRLVDKG